ncbi:hypothetical protein Hanom_Chr04g00367651 [Helianthus anomalus]
MNLAGLVKCMVILFGATELKLHHVISNKILIYPWYVPEPDVNYRVFHYGLEFSVGN